MGEEGGGGGLPEEDFAVGFVVPRHFTLHWWSNLDVLSGIQYCSWNVYRQMSLFVMNYCKLSAMSFYIYIYIYICRLWLVFFFFFFWMEMLILSILYIYIYIVYLFCVLNWDIDFVLYWFWIEMLILCRCCVYPSSSSVVYDYTDEHWCDYDEGRLSSDLLLMPRSGSSRCIAPLTPLWDIVQHSLVVSHYIWYNIYIYMMYLAPLHPHNTSVGHLKQIYRCIEDVVLF